MLMRDPVLYRIRHAEHYRQGDAWCIYPLYDYAHCLEDAFEDVTHSICTIEFENNRELYDWVLESVGFEEPRPHQYEWAGLDLENAVLSKRAIGPLVQAGVVSGWDDPRLATIAGYRRRGIPPEAIRLLAKRGGGFPGRGPDGGGQARVRDPGGAQPRRAACHGRARAAQGRDHQLARGRDRNATRRPYFPPDVDREGDARRSRSVESSGSTARTSRRTRPRDSAASFRAVRSGCAMHTSMRCDEVVKDDAGNVVELRCSYDAETRSGAVAGRGGR